MGRRSLAFFQSGYEELNKLVKSCHQMEEKLEELSVEKQKYQELRGQIYNSRSGRKYGPVARSTDVTYTEEELNSLRMELSRTGILAFIKQLLGADRRVYYELVGKLNALIYQLESQEKEFRENLEATCQEITEKLRYYQVESNKTRAAAGAGADSDWTVYHMATSVDGCFLLGDIRRQLSGGLPQGVGLAGRSEEAGADAPSQLPDGAGAAPGSLTCVDQEGWMNIPYPWSIETPLPYICNYQKGSAQTACQAMHALLLQMLRLSPEFHMEFSFMDGAEAGANFGEMRPLVDVRKMDVVYLNRKVTQGNFHLAQLCPDEHSISQKLESLDGWMTLVARELGEYHSLTEYNQENGNQAWIPYQTVVIDNFPDGFSDKGIQILNRMLINGAKLGISVILLNNLDRWAERNRNNTYGKESSIETVLTKEAQGAALWFDLTEGGANYREGEEKIPCILVRSREDRKEYIGSLIADLKQEKILDNHFQNLFDIEHTFGEEDSTDGLHIPFAVTRRGQILEYLLGNAMNAHGLICGGTGSGKSTLLHMLVSSIVMNYSPEDVEIWMADYKITEFYSYKTNTPPHIRFIGLSKTSDFSYAFIDKITAEMERRQNLIAKADYEHKQGGGHDNITSFTDYRKHFGTSSMRRLLVIIDEFHVMSQHAQLEPDYKIRLENILAEARAMGIIMLFSDQAIVDGLRGLSDKGKKQIKARIALSNYLDELKETLGENDRSKLLSFVHMKTGEVAVQTVRENEDKEEVATIERAMAIYIDGEWRYKVSAKARRFYHSENYVADSFDDRVQEFMDLEEIRKWEEQLPGQHRDGTRDTQIYLGKPVDLRFALSFPLLRRSGNNIMSVSGTEEQQMRVLKAITASFGRQNPYEIVLLCDPYAGIYREYLPEIQALAHADPNIKIVDQLPELCHEVNRLLSITNDRGNQKRVLAVWLGLDAVAEELSSYPRTKPEKLEQLAREGTSAPVKEPETASSGKTQETKELEDAFGALFGMFEEEPAPATPQADKNAANTPDTQTAGSKSSETVGGAGEFSDDLLYDARDDIARLIHIGPGRNVFHLVIYDTAAALQDFKAVKKADFRHKIAFAMSDGEAGEYLERASLVHSLPEHMGYYHNGRAGKKFIPYKL